MKMLISCNNQLPRSEGISFSLLFHNLPPVRIYRSMHACTHTQSCLTLSQPHGLGGACQAPLSMGFPSQECWSGFPSPSPGIFPTKGSNPLFRVFCISRILYPGAIWEFTLSHALPKGFPGSLQVKVSVCSAETWVRSLGREDPLEKEMATHSSTLAWRIPWAEEPGGLQSMGSESNTTEWLHFTWGSHF